MVMTTSEAWTASVVSSFGVLAVMSMPTSAIASTAAGLISVGRLGAGRADLDPVAGQVAQPAGGHLGAAGVVHADEQHAGLVGHDAASSGSGVRQDVGDDGAMRVRHGDAAGRRPTDRADELRDDEHRHRAGAMPAKVSVNVRPTVTAGLAKLVELVNQYAAPM